MNICIFGASITYGYYDQKMGGYVQRIRHYLENKNKFDGQIFNLGVSGASTKDILKRFDIEAEARRPGLIIFSLNTNDTQFLIKENKQRVTIKDYVKNINELINKARKFTPNIIFIGIAAVNDNKTNPLPWATNKVVGNKTIEKYNNTAMKICERGKIKFINLYSEMINLDYKSMLFDGLHPNAEGHQWMAERIIKEINL
ncbi:MAG: GDSL-type esterase/lipase family protein [Parcubacteria group bacterium]|jgi:lysophospholipase L1-like esterase